VKAIGYARVSSQEQKYGETIKGQETIIRDKAVTEGWRLLGIYRDEALSGSNGLDTRDGLSEALAALETGEAQVLIVKDFSRLARDLILQETLIQRLGAVNVRVEAVLEPEVGGDEHTRTLVRQVLGAVKQYERAVIRATMEAGRARAIAEGRRGQGQPPFGWRAARDERGRRGLLEQDPNEQRILATLKAWQAEGLPLAEVARRANAEGLPTRRGARWHPTSISRVLGR